MYWFSIIYFFIVSLLAGTLVDLFVRGWKADWLEKLVMRFGVGLSSMSVVGVILNLFRIPIDYRVFLGISVLILLGAITRNKPSFSNPKDKLIQTLMQFWRRRSFWYGLFILILFSLTLNMYLEGAFKYNYFEDSDPWGYTAVADYIGENKTFSVPYYSLQYSEPYTQGYQIVMGVLSQTNDSIYWTMKFFTSLIISFGVLFMYFFVRRFSRSEEVALLAATFLFAVPAWVSHFVFSLHFNMTVFVVLLYVLAQLMPGKRSELAVAGDLYEKGSPDAGQCPLVTENSSWLWIGIIVYASMLINHFSTFFQGTVFFVVFFVTRVLVEKKFDWKPLAVFFGGLLLSLLFFVPAYARHWWLTTTTPELGGVENLFPLLRFVVTLPGMISMAFVIGVGGLIFWKRTYWQTALEEWINCGNRGMVVWLWGLALVMIVLFLPIEISQSLGTGDKDYGLKDFFSASSINMMNNPIGLGPVVMSAVLVSFLLAMVQIKKWFKYENAWIAISYSWLITAFLLVLGKYFSIAIAPFRAWTFLGLFASLFAAWGIVALVQLLSKNEWVLLGVMVVLTIILVPTTFLPKRQVNTMVWQDHTIGASDSHALFVWMRNGGIPKNSVVAHLCGNSEFLSGYDMNPPLWNNIFHPARGVDEPFFVNYPINLTSEAFNVLRNADVEYVSLGASCLWQAPVPVEHEAAYGTFLRTKMDQYMSDPRLDLIKNTGVEILFKLK